MQMISMWPYAAATVSAVSGCPGKASGGRRKDARGTSIIGLSMAVLPCRAEEDVEAGSAALRVDWPVYPRGAEHNTVAEGGNRRWAETAPAGLPPRSDAGSGLSVTPEGRGVPQFQRFSSWANPCRPIRLGLWRPQRSSPSFPLEHAVF